ncbi:hypothetical protein SAMN05444484_102701 [Flavobacterium chilense]|uniref:Uncharacterized protein n=1 Tax=Flavobacterium chilense TaxID=946677 RepID=A0A1M7DSI3_9FLAO|nr:hypothetical protein SAMN05444484_102701 [Flavobacterium chilense]
MNLYSLYGEPKIIIFIKKSKDGTKLLGIKKLVHKC